MATEQETKTSRDYLLISEVGLALTPLPIGILAAAVTKLNGGDSWEAFIWYSMGLAGTAVATTIVTSYPFERFVNKRIRGCFHNSSTLPLNIKLAREISTKYK